MTWTPVLISGAKTPVGAYSPAIRAGNHIFLSGQVPTNLETGEIIGNDVATQTNAVIDRIEVLLGAAGATLRDIVSVTVYLSDIANWEAFNQAYRSRLTAPYPTRTTVGAGLHGFLVEITVIAYLGD